MQQTVRLDFTLNAGAVSEPVEVSSAVDQLQSENAMVGAVITNRDIVELPLNGRNNSYVVLPFLLSADR